MSLLVTYKPQGEETQQFENESFISIQRAYDSPAKATITLPKTFATRNMNGYGQLRIEYNGVNLFDGKTQRRKFDPSGKIIVLQANDWLWDFTKKKRSFYQSTDMKPHEAFTEAFDQNSNFGDYTGYWEDYITPFIDGFDALSKVVPADNLDLGDYFDGENKTGDQFMKFVAKSAYLGDKYKYHYWYQLLNDTKTLFFEPEGWGEVHKGIDWTISGFEESWEDIYNNVVVWGGKSAGNLPLDGDYWTEQNIDGWDAGLGSVALSNTQVTTGLYSTLFTLVGGTNTTDRYITQVDHEGNIKYTNLEAINELRFKIYPDNNISEMQFHLIDNNGNSAQKDIEDAGWVANAWNTAIVSTTTADANIALVGVWTTIQAGFNWDQIKFIRIWVFGTGADLMYMDNLHFNRWPTKSQNTSNATGYDSTSESDYGFREFSINDRWLNTYTKCNALASNLVNYYKDPQYTSTATIPAFKPVNLNERFYGDFEGNLLTLPINSVNWSFKDDWQTTINLGIKRMNPSEILKKLYYDTEAESYDRGQTYYVY